MVMGEVRLPLAHYVPRQALAVAVEPTEGARACRPQVGER